MSETTRPATREIVDHYSSYDESKRLRGDIGPLERVRTQELMRRALPPAPAVVLDVGGATGVYALWLAGLGYQVHLVDIVPHHVEQARREVILSVAWLTEDEPVLGPRLMAVARKLSHTET